MEGFLTVREVSEATGYSEGHVRKLLGAGVVAGERVGYTWLIDGSEVEKLRRRRARRRRARTNGERMAELSRNVEERLAELSRTNGERMAD